MPPFHSYLSVAWCVIAGLACATGTDFEKGNPAPPSRVITHDEIVDTKSAGNAYQAVFLLRPDWIRPRGESLLNPVIMPVVFVDNMRHGPMESLAQPEGWGGPSRSSGFRIPRLTNCRLPGLT